MDPDKKSDFLSINSRNLLYRLKISFGFFFLIPATGFMHYAVKYDLFTKEDSIYYVIAFLALVFVGVAILREMVRGVEEVAKNVAGEVSVRLGDSGFQARDELEEIANSFRALTDRLEETDRSLARRLQEIRALRDLNHLTLGVSDPEILLSHSLDRSMEVAGAMGGAIYSIESLEGHSLLSMRAVAGKGLSGLVGSEVELADHPAQKVLEQGRTAFLHRHNAKSWNMLLSEDAGHAVAVPVPNKSSTWGIAVLVSSKESPFPNDVLEFLTPFFATLGMALELDEIGIRERERSEDLKAVLDIIKLINSGLSGLDMMEALAAKLNELFPHDWIGLALTDSKNRELRLTYASPNDQNKLPMGLVFPETRSLFKTATRLGGVVQVEDLKGGPNHFEKSLLKRFGLGSIILAGLSVRGDKLGAICLGSKTPHAFSRRHGRLLGMIAEEMALAVEQSRLLERFKNKAGELEVLNRVGQALTSSTFNMDRVLTYTLEMISGLMNVDAGSLLLLKDDELVFEVALGEVGESLKDLRMKVGQGVAGWVAASGEPMIVNDVKESPHFSPEFDAKTGFTTKNLLCVPMIVGGRTIGVIEVLNKVRGAFNEGDLRILKSVASSAAIALENSRLYDKSTQVAKKERIIRSIFQKYVPEEVASEILDLGERDLITLGERRMVTLLNVDIRGYTRLSKTSSAEQVIAVLNYFFMVMGNTVLRYHGILDKYLGDGLLAIFGAPVTSKNHALMATQAAVEMVEKLEEVNRYVMEQIGVPIGIGVSINSGEAIVGNIGFEKKMDYTAIGEVVNDTFGLQDLTKERLNSILISDTTQQQVSPFVFSRSLGLKTLEGGTRMEVFEVTGKREMSDLEYLVYQARLKEEKDKGLN